MLNKKDLKVVLLENISPLAVDFFKKKGYADVTSINGSPSADELLDIIKDVNILGIRSRTKLTKEVLTVAKNLLTVGCFSIGTDQVDGNFAKELGIPVFNAPFANTRSVAELAICEIISLMRKIPEKNKSCHGGIWAKGANGCFEIKEKTLGIIGYGHIGTQVGLMAEALNMNVIYYDVEKKLSLGSAKPVDTMEELLKIADVVTLHIPAQNNTNLFGKKQFDLMKKGAYFLNLARGKIVDVDALAEAIRSKHLAGAGVDVYPTEPTAKGEVFDSKLREFDNVILTPHDGGSTEEAQVNIAIDVAGKLNDFVSAGKTALAINFPEINLSENLDVCRILHVHKNIPGVMMEINKIFGECGINIIAQYLQTENYLGYTIMDIGKGLINEEIIRRLGKVNNTIKVLVV